MSLPDLIELRSVLAMFLNPEADYTKQSLLRAQIGRVDDAIARLKRGSQR